MPIPRGITIQLNRKAIFVSITKANRGDDPAIDANTTPEDRARGYWHVNDGKAGQCELLVAVDDGIIVRVWEIDRDFGWRRWENANDIPTQHHPDRDVDSQRKYCQLLRVAPENAQLEGRQITDIEGMSRMRGPIDYNF